MRWFKFNKKKKQAKPLETARKSRHGKQEQLLQRGVSIKIRANRFVSELAGDLYKFYDVGDLLGHGGYGDVYKCVHKQTGAERAVKIISKDKTENAKIQQEFNVLRDLDHPNILKEYALFQNDKSFFIVTDEYKGGELFDYLAAHGTFSEDDAAVLMKHVLACLNYCHKQGVAHRDLKLENILLEQSLDLSDIKIIDFGFARRFDPNDGSSKPVFNSQVGSVFYTSPQVYDKKYSAKCDVWSCGVIAFFVLSGYAPFDGEDDNDIIAKIVTRDLHFDDVWHEFSEEAKNFIDYLLTYEEDKRPTAEEALRHPWITQKRRHSKPEDDERRRSSARQSLTSLQAFSADSKLKQAVCSLIASQLLSASEKEEIDSVFRSLDANSDGKLCQGDLKAAYKEHFAKDIGEEEVDEILEQVNYSCSGAIEYSEFIVATMVEKELVDEQRVKRAFRMFDRERKGYISYDDLFQTLGIKEGGIHDDYVARKILEPVDLDGNGQIDFEEFAEVVAPHLNLSTSEKEGEEDNEEGAKMDRTKLLRSTDRESFRTSDRELELVEGQETATTSQTNTPTLSRKRSTNRESYRTSDQGSKPVEGLEVTATAPTSSRPTMIRRPSLPEEHSFRSLVNTVEEKLLSESFRSINAEA